MKESNRISSLFNDLFDGNPWIDVNLVDSLYNLTAEQASRRILPRSNTIWEITNHMISWRKIVLKRLQGKIVPTAPDNYVEPVPDQSALAWKKTLSSLTNTQKARNQLLENYEAQSFSKIYPGNGMDHYKHIHGILQHDAYHLGQIKMLLKYV